MIQIYNKIAQRLEKISVLIWMCFFLSLVFCIYVFISNQQIVDPKQELAVAVFPLWFLTMIGVKQYFISITEKPKPELGFFKKLLINIKRLFSLVVAWIFTLVTCLVFYLSYKAVMFVI